MHDQYSQINLAEIEDAAPANGFADRWQARVARTALGAQQTGLTYFRLLAGKRSPFVHRHASAEEIYVVLSGTGRLKVDDEIVDVRALDAIRVAPEVAARLRRAVTVWCSSPWARIILPTRRQLTTTGSNDERRRQRGRELGAPADR